MIGKDVRLERIINRKNRKTVIVPMDHGVTVGPILGIIDLKEAVDKISEGGANAIILHKGQRKPLPSAILGRTYAYSQMLVSTPTRSDTILFCLAQTFRVDFHRRPRQALSHPPKRLPRRAGRDGCRRIERVERFFAYYRPGPLLHTWAL